MSTKNVQTVSRALTVLRVLGEHPAGLSLAGLARATDLPLSTLHRLLATLREHDLVRETDRGLQKVGVGTVALARTYLDGLELREESLPILRELLDSTGETCHLGVLAGPNIVYIEKMDSPDPVRMHSRIGGTGSALRTGMGRAMLAYTSDETVADVVAMAVRLTGEPADPDELSAVLETVRANGYATDLEENEPGICCVAAPVFDHTGGVMAAISVSTPASRFDRSEVREQGALVRAAADRLSSILGVPMPKDGKS